VKLKGNEEAEEAALLNEEAVRGTPNAIIAFFGSNRFDP